METFEYSGIWWLPDNPNDELTGSLKFDHIDGARLDLVGTFDNQSKFNDLSNKDIILGVIPGKLVTLYRCLDKGTAMSAPGYESSSYFVTVVFFGHHFDSKEDIVFTSLSVNYIHLEDWTRISGFTAKREFDEDNHLKRYNLTYEFPEAVKARVGDLQISFDYHFRDTSLSLKGTELKHTTFIKIEPDSPMHFDDYRNQVLFHVQNFISLGVGKPIYPLIVKGKCESSKMELSKDRIVYNDIFAFYRVLNFQTSAKSLWPNDMLFSYKDIKDDYDRYLNNWFQKSEALRPTYDLYFGVVNSPSLYLQYEFLSLAQALESYHRRIHDRKYYSKSAYKTIYENLITALPNDADADFKNSAKNKLRYLNEVSLKTRVREILNLLGDSKNLLITNEKQFIEDFSNTRNFLTHYEKKLEKKAKANVDLYYLIQKVRFLVESCLLIEIGLTSNQVKELMKNNRKYTYLSNELKSKGY